MIAVEDRAGPHHVPPGGWTADDRGAIGHVHDAGIESQRTHAGQRRFECFFLLDRLLGGETSDEAICVNVPARRRCRQSASARANEGISEAECPGGSFPNRS